MSFLRKEKMVWNQNEVPIQNSGLKSDLSEENYSLDDIIYIVVLQNSRF